MRFLLGILALATLLSAQRLTEQQFRAIGKACIPDSPRPLIERIVWVESGFQPYALSINYPEREAKRLHLPPGKVFLTTQPSTKEEALRWARILQKDGYTVSVGLMQVSAADHPERVEGLLDPCENLRAGWQTFQEKYRQAEQRGVSRSDLLRSSLAAYNSGGLWNASGLLYAEKVLAPYSGSGR